VRRIEDEKGRDRTHEVLVNERSLRVGGPPPAKRDNPPPGAARWAVLGHASAANPTRGTFGHDASDGFAADLGIERRTRRKESYGLRIDFSEFGGKGATEELLSSTYSGAVDQLRYRFLGATLFSRYFFLPDRRFNPFLLAGLGGGTSKLSLTGPHEGATSSSFVWTTEVGLGATIRLAPAIDAELSSSYFRAPSGTRYLKTPSVSLGWPGTMQYFRFTAGLVRRFGPSR
jgi:hypothetical protein